ncbi:hypothetical protein KY347_02045 [Candidatus Woesearchaeota archaeon]|nr:hypothetical protein [Candidatus Woesearchaeota archaeon]
MITKRLVWTDKPFAGEEKTPITEEGKTLYCYLTQDCNQFAKKCLEEGIRYFQFFPEDKVTATLLTGLNIIQYVLSDYPELKSKVCGWHLGFIGEVKTSPSGKIIDTLEDLCSIDYCDCRFVWDWYLTPSVLVTVGNGIGNYFFNFNDAIVSVLSAGNVRVTKAAIDKEQGMPGLVIEIERGPEEIGIFRKQKVNPELVRVSAINKPPYTQINDNLLKMFEKYNFGYDGEVKFCQGCMFRL